MDHLEKNSHHILLVDINLRIYIFRLHPLRKLLISDIFVPVSEVSAYYLWFLFIHFHTIKCAKLAYVIGCNLSMQLPVYGLKYLSAPAQCLEYLNFILICLAFCLVYLVKKLCQLSYWFFHIECLLYLL